MKRIFILSLLLLLLSAWAWGDGLRYDATVATPAADISVQTSGTGISYHKLTWTLSAASITACNIQLDSSVDGTTWTAGGAIASLDCHAANGVTAVTSGVFNYVRINVTAVSGGNVSIVWNGYVTQPSGGGTAGTGSCTNQVVTAVNAGTPTCASVTTAMIGTLAAGSNGLATSAITDATNASNISSGTLNIARLGTLVAGSNGLATSATTDATNASNISAGTLAAARGGAGAITGALKANGSGLVTQAACADLSNAAASCATDTTSASNISTGTLNIARLGTLAAGSNGLATSATTDATNASNISSGTLANARLTFNASAWLTYPTLGSGTPTTGGTANKASLWGVVLQFSLTTTKVTYETITGGTSGGTYDIGIYDSTGALKAHTGNTAEATNFTGTNTLHTLNWLASASLSPGKYYVAISCSATALCATFAGASSNGVTFLSNTTVSVAAGGTLDASVTPPADSMSYGSAIPVWVVQ